MKDSSLTFLDLNTCKIPTEGIAEIARSVANSPLTSLNLSANSINTEGITEIAKGLRNSSLIFLNLSHNCASADGIAAIVDAYEFYDSAPKLTTLILSNCDIAPDASTVLASLIEHLHSCLTFLDIGNNEIKYDGIIEILTALKHSNISRLRLYANCARYKDVECIAELIKDTALINLDIDLDYYSPIVNAVLEENKARIKMSRFAKQKCYHPQQ